jgi:hypothetical protein
MPAVASNSGGGGHGASKKSWLAATIIVAGFVVGGIAIIYWNWPIFWVGVGITVLGMAMGAAVGMMEEVTEYGAGSTGAGSTRPAGGPASADN